MPVDRYGVLRARPIDRRLGAGQNPHFQIHCVAGAEDFRIAINVKSRQHPSSLLYLINERFTHPISATVEAYPLGFTELRARTPDGGGLDFIRGNLFDPREMTPLPHDLPGPDNDLNEKFDAIVQRALADETGEVFAFGAVWGPEQNRPDNYFGFRPGRGIHEIHMNQGSVGQFERSNGVWQDGAIFFRFPEQRQLIAVFTAFQSQSWHTDDRTGDRIGNVSVGPGEGGDPTRPEDGELPTEDLPDGLVRISAALVNPSRSPERETVTLLNTSNVEVDLSGWQLKDKQKKATRLDGKLGPGATRSFVVQAPMALSNQGGIISLINPRGLKVDGVSYSRQQARHVDWTIKF
jgi:uncharacterized protein YukJ